MRAIAGIAVAMVLVNCADAQSKADAVPFVGCPADGQQGYIAPPQGQPMVVGRQDVSLDAIAYYKGDYAPGVFAPNGWHCRVWYGSSGSSLLVTPTAIDTTHFMPPKVLGPAVEMRVSFAGTSGRFSVARYGSRLFPRMLASFIGGVKNEHIAPDSEFAPRQYARDSVTWSGHLIADFITPPGVSGLGTAEILGPSSDPIHGVAVIAPDSTEPDMSILRVRLGANMRQVEGVVLRLNRECMQQTDGC
jgi:hypothetical protein